MKLEDFDFRLYVISEKDYVRDEDKYQILTDLKTKSEFMERNNIKEPKVILELFTGCYDKNKNKIYEGDIVYYLEGFYKVMYMKYHNFVIRPISYQGLDFVIFDGLSEHLEIRGNANNDIPKFYKK